MHRNPLGHSVARWGAVLTATVALASFAAAGDAHVSAPTRSRAPATTPHVKQPKIVPDPVKAELEQLQKRINALQIELQSLRGQFATHRHQLNRLVITNPHPTLKALCKDPECHVQATTLGPSGK